MILHENLKVNGALILFDVEDLENFLEELLFLLLANFFLDLAAPHELVQKAVLNIIVPISYICVVGSACRAANMHYQMLFLKHLLEDFVFVVRFPLIFDDRVIEDEDQQAHENQDRNEHTIKVD